MWQSAYYIMAFLILFLFCGSLIRVEGQELPSTSAQVRFQASEKTRLVTVSVVSLDTTLRLPDRFVIQHSEKIFLDTILLKQPEDFLLDLQNGILYLRASRYAGSTADTMREWTLQIRYDVYPFHFRESYRRRELVWRADTTGEMKKVARPVASFSVDDLFSANLQKSGSIVRGFTIGSNRDLSLTSGFRMQMAGKIASDVDVVAALSDENTPIQPEGNTQTLQEIDKVFVQIRSSDLSATLGDFAVEFGGNEFGRYNRKLQGAMGTGNYSTEFGNGSLVLSGAVSRGKFVTNQFQGTEGVQGPYRLTGRNNERSIIIIAGSERVFVDGETMTRGETNDYTIDYASGDLTFTSRRLITGASRIVVDFEYSDRQFTRTVVGGKVRTASFSDRFKLNATFVKEADDPDSPIDISLSDADKAILRDAGGDQRKATRSGVDSVGPGRGQYVAIDTVVNGTPTRFYRFAPADSNAIYSITFTHVGTGKGEYVRVSLGNYRYVGSGQGSYVPVRFLPLAQSQSLLDFDVTAQLTDEFSLFGEYAWSGFDANRFSALDDAAGKGFAANYGLKFGSKSVRVGGANIGGIDFVAKERRVDRRFAPIDRTNEIEFNRRWNLQQSHAEDELQREGSLSYQPVHSLTFRAGLGSIRRGEIFSANRTELSGSLTDSLLPRVSYNFEYIRSRDLTVDDNARWYRHSGNSDYRFGIITPGFRYGGEVRRLQSLVTDTLRAGSFRYNEYAPRVVVSPWSNMIVKSEFVWRMDDAFFSGSLAPESKSFTQTYSWSLREWQSLSSTIDVTLRKKKFAEQFRLKGNSDIETTLLRGQLRYTPYKRGVETDWFYEAASQRTAKLERMFLRVARGSGNYRYLGDVNGNGVDDEADFQLDRFEGDYMVVTAPSDELFPIVDLKASTRVRITPSRFLRSDEGLLNFLKVVSTETYFRVEEKSKDPETRNIYFLQLGKFLNDQTTLSGNNYLSQDLHLFENNQEYSLRARFVQRKGFTQFSTASERSYLRERSVRFRWQLVEEIANQVDYVNKLDRVTSPQASARMRDILSNSILSDWSYRPEQRLEIGFSTGVGRSVDRDAAGELVADLNNQAVRLVYSFESRGQGRIEFHREEATLQGQRRALPFELTSGRVVGKTWLWRTNFDYRISQAMQITIGYDGRSEAGGTPIHSARAEAKAFF